MKKVCATAREHYDLLVKTSKEGGFPATTLPTTAGTARCRYRTPDGRKCGVGLLIPDAAYDPEWDGLVPDQPPEDQVRTNGLAVADLPEDVRDGILPEGMTLADLEEVQSIHDRFALRSRDHYLPWPHADFVAQLSERVPAFHDFTPYPEGE